MKILFWIACVVVTFLMTYTLGLVGLVIALVFFFIRFMTFDYT